MVMNYDESELLRMERFLSEFDLCDWEKDILIEFDKSKDIHELLKFVKRDDEDDFLRYLAEGIKQYLCDRVIPNNGGVECEGDGS
jgi:hypothetical protein